MSANKSRELRLVRDEPSRSEPSSDLVEEQLISALERGEPVGAGLLYDHLIAAIEGTLFRVMGTRGPDHDDLVQNTFEQIMVSLRKKRFARACSLRSWAAAIATHMALNGIRSRRTEGKYFDRETSLDDQLGREGPHDPERDTQLQRDVSIMRALLAELPVEQARALLLHDALGYELSEISVLTNASVAAAQSRLARGRRKLREKLIERGVRVQERT